MSIRKQLNKLLRRYGYEINEVNRFEELLISQYEKSPDFFFVQVGANDGIKFDDLYGFTSKKQCSGIVIEPLGVYFEKLKQNYAGHPNITAVNLAIHASKKRAEIHYPDPGRSNELPEWAQGIGSLDKEHHKKSKTPSEYITTEEVNCIHLMDLLAEHQVEKIDLLQVDVEGYDAEVIRMIDFKKVQPALIKYEHQSLDRGEQRNITKLLTSQRYAVFKQGTDTIAVKKCQSPMAGEEY